MLHKVNTGFSKLRDKEFDNKTEFIIESLSGNAAFPAPNPTLVNVQAQLDAYRKALATTGPGQTEAVRKSRKDLEQILGQLALNLEGTANVTDADLASSGFDMRKDPVHTDAPIGAPGNLRLRHTGNTGEVQVLCEPVDRSGMYHVQKALSVDGPYTDAGPNDGRYSSTRRMLLAGLERAKDIWVRARAISTTGEAGPWSNPATILVT